MSDVGPLVRPWEPKIEVVDDYVAQIELPTDDAKGQVPTRVILNRRKKNGDAWAVALSLGKPLWTTRDARNLGRALLAGAAWLDVDRLKDEAAEFARDTKTPEQSVATPWNDPTVDPLGDLNRLAAAARDKWLEAPMPMIEQVKGGLSVPVSNETKEEFYRKFGEVLAVGTTFTDEQLVWLESRHQRGKL